MLAFVLGTIAAPLSHYVFMLATTPVGMAGVHGAGFGSDDGHETGSHAVDAMHVHGNVAAVSDPTDAHATCDYADLFATFSATDAPASEFVVITDCAPAHEVAPAPAPGVELILPFHLRGPPATSA